MNAQDRTSPRRVKINLQELIDAMTWNSEESRTFLDLRTGNAISLETSLLAQLEEGEALDDLPDWQKDDIAIAEAVLADDPNWIEVEPVESHESFRIMEDFVAQLRDEDASEVLLRALEGKKPFRRFKDALAGSVREQWIAFENSAQERFARQWLESMNIELDPG